MRVKIGPYRDYFGPYQIADKVFFWVRNYRFDDPLDITQEPWDYKAREKFGDWLAETWVSGFCNWLDKFKKRKVEVHIDPYDTWSMDHTLALIIHPMLVQLKKMNHGYFSSDPEDAPQIGKGEETDYGGNDTLALDRYNWIMDEMIWTFAQLVDIDGDLQFYNEKTGYDLEASGAYQDRIKNGLRLFGKYYRGLWD
jgi:hypothetical protein